MYKQLLQEAIRNEAAVHQNPMYGYTNQVPSFVLKTIDDISSKFSNSK